MEATWSLFLSGVAVAVAVAAAAFSGWQALLTARRNRLETEAYFRLESRRHESSSGMPDESWFLTNVGKVDSFEVRVTMSFDPAGREYGSFSFGQMAPGATVMLEPSRPLPRPSSTFTYANGKWIIETARVTWRSAQGTTRQQKIEMTGNR